MLVRNAVLIVSVLTTSACQDVRAMGGAQAEGPPQYVLSEAPSVTIGAREESAHQLTFPVGALRLSTGDIVVAESLTRDLRYFDQAGSHLFTVGGRGEGPGEFSSLRAVGRLENDRVWTWDARQRRVQLFDRAGSVTKSVSITAWPDVAQNLLEGRARHGVSPYDVQALNDGTLIVTPLFQPMLTERGIVRDTIPLILVSPDGTSWSEARPLPVIDDWLVHDGIAGMLPLGDRVHVGAGGDAVYVTSRHAGVIARVAPGRQAVDTIVPMLARRALSDRDARAVYTDIEASRGEAYAEAIPMPDSLPALSGIKVGSGGRIWLKAYVGPTDALQRWTAVQETGEVVASVSMPVELEVMDLGIDYAIVLVRDEFDVPAIRLHSFVPAG